MSQPSALINVPTNLQDVLGAMFQQGNAVQATLAAANIAAHLQSFPVWTKPDVLPFVDGPFDQIPKAAPSIVNAKDLGLKEFQG